METPATHRSDSEDWEAFHRAHGGFILSRFKAKVIGAPPGVEDEDDLRQTVYLKMLEKGDPARLIQRSRSPDTDHARIDSLLREVTKNHFIDNFIRRRNREKKRAARAYPRLAAAGYRTMIANPPPDRSGDLSAIEPVDPAPDPWDRESELRVLRVLDVVQRELRDHHTLRRMRDHCRAVRKPEIWSVFEERQLARAFYGRQAKSTRELLEMFPHLDKKKLDNRMTSAWRIFRRILSEVVQPDEIDRVGLEGWLEILLILECPAARSG